MIEPLELEEVLLALVEGITPAERALAQQLRLPTVHPARPPKRGRARAVQRVDHNATRPSAVPLGGAGAVQRRRGGGGASERGAAVGVNDRVNDSLGGCSAGSAAATACPAR